MARRRRFDPEEMDPDELEEKLEAEGVLDARGLLRDGRSLRVPLYLKDGSINSHLSAVQRSIAASKTAQPTQDAVARGFGLSDGLQLHRPGFRRNTSDAAALERTRQAYADADIEASNAWKGSTADARAGDPCTVRGPEFPHDHGAQGTLQQRNGGWVCVPSNPRQDAATFDAKAAAYAEYDREMADAWRTSK